MPIQGPWYISARAVRDYLEIKGARVVDDGPDFEQAERELLEMAADCVEAERREHEPRKPSKLDSGHWRYRGPKPRRLTLVVSYEKRDEGHLPQLIRVTAGESKGTPQGSRPKHFGAERVKRKR